jgi:hypothetical protein
MQKTIAAAEPAVSSAPTPAGEHSAGAAATCGPGPSGDVDASAQQPAQPSDGGDDDMGGTKPEHKKQRLANLESQKIRKEDVSAVTQRKRTSELEEPNRIISEVYSRPRAAPMASKHGVIQGSSIDLKEIDPHDGMPWDLDIPAKRERLRRLIREQRPTLLIGSPMCAAFSQLQNLNKGKGDPAMKQELMKRAVAHVKFCCQLYELQVREGRYFLHEHPLVATSWQLPCVIQTMALPGVQVVIAHQCCYGPLAVDDLGPGLVMKPTRFMTNSTKVPDRFSPRCQKDHRHVQLVGGKAAAAAVHPAELCRAIVKGISEQMNEDEKNMLLAVESIVKDQTDDGQWTTTTVEEYRTHANENHGAEFWDHVNGGKLDRKEVMKARRTEIEYIRRMKVYERVPYATAMERTGRQPIKV